MLIINHPDTYQCSVCHTEYSTSAKAIFCETQNPLGACPVDLGQTVHVVLRYDGLTTDTVTALRIGCYSRFLIENGCLDKMQHIVPHQWLVQTQDSHQVGKDEPTDWLSNTCCLELDITKEWNPFYHKQLEAADNGT